MPEGPTLVMLREETQRFVGKTIVHAEGSAKAVDMASLQGKRVKAIRSYGKQFLIVLPNTALRIHFLLFGSYRIDERKDSKPRLSLQFAKGGELNFYASSVRQIDADVDAAYDWRSDIMAPEWDPALARKRLRAEPDMLVCDALLNQDIFAGVGNIIKNEVLFRIRVHPLSTVGALPAPKLRQLVEQAREYSFEFLEWKRAGVLKQHWLAHRKSICPRCQIPYSKGKLGRTQRRAFYCEQCQRRYD
ncbi:MAG: DNA-formamidopyrimidine glycosylase family protein [Massilia sp.]